LFASQSFSATVVFFGPNVGPLADIAAIQFDIISPSDADVSDFNPNFPSGWFDFSTRDTVNAFDSTGTNSFPGNTNVGTFDIDVILDNWVLGNQTAQTLTEGVDYQVTLASGQYSITAIPIPSTILLLGGGLAALVGLRRRKSS
jgi:hypothetical protein